MDEDAAFDLLMELEETVPIEQRAERMEAEAQRLEPGEYGRASLLIAAGEHWQMRREYDRAHRAFDAAKADGGESAAGPDVAFLGLALERGDTDGAARHREALRALTRADQLSPIDFLEIGDLYEDNDQLREAHRWYTMPLTYADPDDEDLDYFCLVARLRVREALGLPQDRFDRIAFEERERQQTDVP